MLKFVKFVFSILFSEPILKKEEEEEKVHIMKKTKKENKAQELIDFVFSWSIADIMNQDLYKDKVYRIPKTFSSAENYLKSFISPLIEETHADLNSKFTTLFHAPSCELYDVDSMDDSEELLYVVSLKPGGSYEPEYGDLIALTEVKPRGIDDLDRPKRPYTIALVKGMREEDSDEIPILSSKPIMFEKQDKENGVVGDKLFAVYLTNLTTNSRIWKALHPDMEGGNFDIINSVLRTNPSVEEVQCSICPSNKIESLNVSKSRECINPLVLDDSQKHAVLNCIATRECHHKKSVKLIWGPPGTGKTKTISALVFALLKIKCRTLTCAPTNIAVIGVTKRLISLLGGTLAYENYGLGDVVLFGNGERMKIDDHEDLFDIFLDYRVKVLVKCFAPLTGWNGSLLSMIGLLEDPEDQYLRFLREEKNEILEESEKVDNEEEKERNDLKSRKENEGKNEIGINKGKLKMKSSKEIIIRDLKEAKKKNSKDRERRESKKDKNKNHEKEESSGNNEEIQCTFEEFFTKAFRNYGEQLMLCVTGLCTHMPTSHLPLEIVKKMIRVLELLQTLQTLINSSKGLLRQELKGNEETSGTKLATNMSSIRLQCLEVLKSFRGSFSVPKYIEYYQIRSFCLTNAILVFCTASSSAKLYTEGSKPIELVIIDEAAQLKECESSIPLQLFGVRNVVLVGDEKQLPAMVQSKICEKVDFGRSLFERLVMLGHSKHLLNVQYRMHPSISLFPNREFYRNQIRNGQNVTERAYERRFLKEKIFGSYSFIDVNNGKEEFDDRYSKKNMVEVSVVAAIVSKLNQESAHSKQKVRVGCISPYKAQVHAIQERLGKTYSTDINDKFSVNVRSVDGFQGGEEDIIIISTVRCNGNGSVGFLSNCQRTNVALTRARYCLWILGNGSTLLNSGSVWKKLVLDAKSRGCFFNAYEDKSLSLSISNALVELGQLNSLFSMDSILFKTSNWKICFSSQFHESMIRFQRLRIHEDVVSILVKLSNGWRQLVKDDSLGHVEGPCSQLLEIYDVKGPIKLIWSIDIFRENSEDIQVIKIWEVVPRIEVPKLANKLDAIFGNYKVNFMSRCLCKRIEGGLTLPMKWPVVTNHELSRQLTALSLGDEPRQSTSRRNSKKRGESSSRW
ncbi:hypothetical protein ACJIZ3_023350 [Penstemon smallii]|uniref:Helicase MAGATAMA 3 n=1 Tax=Penstemon smallii TaxID=265156 RepID=A0ABD3TNV9_9LAMI